MHRGLFPYLILLLLVCAGGAQATSNWSFTGAFQQDDNIATLVFTLNADGPVTLRTWSYAGGTDALGHMIPPGGFDPVLSLFDSTGALITFNDNGDSDVPADPVTGNHWDSYLPFLSLPTGT